MTRRGISIPLGPRTTDAPRFGPPPPQFRDFLAGNVPRRPQESVQSVPAAVFGLYGYESAFVRDKSRLKAWLKARQIGGSSTATLDMVLDAFSTGTDWHTMSRSQRQAKKLLKKAAKHVKAISRFVHEAYGQPRIEEDIGSEEIRLAEWCGGATMTAVPCDADTSVGETTNWLIDEFALFPDSHRLFGLLKPAMSIWGRRMIVLSSPRGKGNKFSDMYDEFTRGESHWSWHTTTLKEANAQGLRLYDEKSRLTTFERFRELEIKDVGEDMFNQEYMCVFSDEVTSLLKWSTIVRCQSPALKIERTTAEMRAAGRDLFVGVDVGRKGDLTAIWVLSRNGDEHSTECVKTLKNVPFPAQKAVIQQVLDTGLVVSCRIDESPIGMELTEYFHRRYPLICQGISFTNANKLEMAGRVQSYMESGNLWIPDDETIARDLASVQREYTDTGLMRLTASHTKSGHADRFWALAMALHASASKRRFELAMAL